MKSVRFSYDAEGDILEATFTLGEVGQRTGIELCDNIVVFTDHALPRVTGLTLLTGVGIAPEDLPKVMEPFFTTKPEGKGTGLGLAICRRVMQEHGGTINIESQVGRGTTVRLELPVANGENAAQLRGE